VTNIAAKFLRLFQEGLRSRIAWILVAFHASCFLFAIAAMSPPSREFAAFLETFSGSSTTIFAGRPFHFHYESALLQVIFLLDLPSAIACVPVLILLSPVFGIFHVGIFVGSYFGASLALFASSVQWLMIGSVAEKRFMRREWGRGLVGIANRYIVALLALIMLASAVGLPLVAARSRRAGMRHGGISFSIR
jgi:hypothetical protein